MKGWLILMLEAPIASFGGTIIDKHGVVRDFPARSMLTGLVGNALGYERSDAEALDRLQDRLVHASALARPGRRERDYQTALLLQKDIGWMTRGVPEGRATSPSFTRDEHISERRGVPTNTLTHQRHRDFDADGCTCVALCLAEAANGPDMAELERALQFPERPLFVGRKPNIPSRPVLESRGRDDHPLLSLTAALESRGVERARIQCDTALVPGADTVATGESDATVALDERWRLHGARRRRVSDERRHVEGVHGGARTVIEGWLRQGAPVGKADSDD